MPKNKASHAHDREYIIPARIENVLESIRHLKNDGDEWVIDIQKRDDDSYRFTALQENPHLRQHLVGVRGRIIRYENNNTRIQLDAHSDKTRLLRLVWWMRLITPVFAIYPVVVLSQYAFFFQGFGLLLLILLGMFPALYVVATMMREGVQERDMLDNTLSKAEIVMDYLQEQHADEFGDITPILKDSHPSADISRLVDNSEVEPIQEPQPVVQVRNNRR